MLFSHQHLFPPWLFSKYNLSPFVQIFAIPQPEIVAAYNRGDIDGGFVWDPALTELKKNGKVLVTSKDVADKGAPTFSAWVATSRSGPAVLAPVITPIPALPFSTHRQSPRRGWPEK